MFKSLQIFICLFIFCAASAQEEVVNSVYFEFDKFNLDEKQANTGSDSYLKKVTKR